MNVVQLLGVARQSLTGLDERIAYEGALIAQLAPDEEARLERASVRC